MTPEERAERRAVARRHHPDLGGDPAAFDEAMRRLDARTTSRPGPVTVHRTTRGRADRLLAAPAALVTRLRRHLPRSFPVRAATAVCDPPAPPGTTRQQPAPAGTSRHQPRSTQTQPRSTADPTLKETP